MNKTKLMLGMFCIVLVLSLSLVSAGFFSCQTDINRDGKINILDMILVRNRLNQDVNSEDNWRADINGNGDISISDLVLVRNYLNTKCYYYSGPYFYYAGGQKNPISLLTDRIAIRFQEGVSLEQQQALIESEEYFLPFSERTELIYHKLTVFPLYEELSEEGIIQLIDRLTRNPIVKVVYPTFGYPDKDTLILTDEFLVKFKSSVSESEIQDFNTLNNVEVIKPLWEGWYLLRVKDPTNFNTLRTTNLYYENPITVYSEPNFVMILHWWP